MNCKYAIERGTFDTYDFCIYTDAFEMPLVLKSYDEKPTDEEIEETLNMFKRSVQIFLMYRSAKLQNERVVFTELKE